MEKEKTSKSKKTLVKGEEKEVVRHPRFAVQFDLDYQGVYNDVSGKPSQTVPDMNLTVRQLLANHTRGLDNGKHHKEPLYFDIKIPKITDITDVEEYRKYLLKQQEQVEKFIKDEKEAAELQRRTEHNTKNVEKNLPEEDKKGEEKEKLA